MPLHFLTNLEIQKHYQNKTRFNGASSRDNLPDKIKDEAYVIHLDKYTDIDTHWITLYINHNAVTYFHSFGVKNIPKETKKSSSIGPQQVFLEFKHMIQ